MNSIHTYIDLMRSVIGIAEMKATRRFEADTRTPICQSFTNPGGISALSEIGIQLQGRAEQCSTFLPSEKLG